MKFKRSEIRHACYRKKNKGTSNKDIIKLVKPLIPHPYGFDDFGVEWDILLNSKGEVQVVRPESDYNFCHSTCIKKKTCVENGIEGTWTDREYNVIQIVELNMLEDKMTWENYHDTWGLKVDYELKRIETKLFKTNVNAVKFPKPEKKKQPQNFNTVVDLSSVESGTESIDILKKKFNLPL